MRIWRRAPHQTIRLPLFTKPCLFGQVLTQDRDVQVTSVDFSGRVFCKRCTLLDSSFFPDSGDITRPGKLASFLRWLELQCCNAQNACNAIHSKSLVLAACATKFRIFLLWTWHKLY